MEVDIGVILLVLQLFFFTSSHLYPYCYISKPNILFKWILGKSELVYTPYASLAYIPSKCSKCVQWPFYNSQLVRLKK